MLDGGCGGGGGVSDLVPESNHAILPLGNMVEPMPLDALDRVPDFGLEKSRSGTDVMLHTA